jgi:hypothetical protein
MTQTSSVKKSERTRKRMIDNHSQNLSPPPPLHLIARGITESPTFTSAAHDEPGARLRLLDEIEDTPAIRQLREFLNAYRRNFRVDSPI